MTTDEIVHIPALGAAAHQAYRQHQAAGYQSALVTVWCITELGPSGEPGLVLSAEKFLGAGGFFAGPIWARS